MSQTFLIVLKPNEAEEPWTPESIEECFLNTTDSQKVGVVEVVADEFSGGWADAMLEVNAKIDNLG